MDYEFELMHLSSKFVSDYPADKFPELLLKSGRSYNCLLIDSHDGYLICIPFRSSVKHNNAYIFTSSKRSERSRSGLDYSKMAIISDLDYLDNTIPAIVDKDEYKEMQLQMDVIVSESLEYVDKYIDHVTGKNPLHSKEYERKYLYSTLPYFHKELGI